MGEEAGMEYSVSVGKSRDAGADAVADRVFCRFSHATDSNDNSSV